METNQSRYLENVSPVQHRYLNQSYPIGCIRSTDLRQFVCVVCYAPAMGSNFDQITCESCKAFFRRNALTTDLNTLICRTGMKNCQITVDTRRRCKYCRLKKCFDQGMRKDFIMSEEDKQSRRQKQEANRQLYATSQGLSPSSSLSYPQNPMHNEGRIQIFSEENVNLLTKIEENYTNAITVNAWVGTGSNEPCIKNFNNFVDVLNEPTHMSALRIITFIKSTTEFRSLNKEDQLTLVKYNTKGTLYLHFAMCVDLGAGLFHEPNTQNDFYYQVNMLRSYSDKIHDMALQLTDEVQRLCCHDASIIKMLIIIVMFSSDTSMAAPTLVNPSKVSDARNVYVGLLWKYLSARFGFEQGPLIYHHLLFCYMKSQTLAHKIKQAVAEKRLQNPNFSQLIQSILLTL